MIDRWLIMLALVFVYGLGTMAARLLGGARGTRDGSAGRTAIGAGLGVLTAAGVAAVSSLGVLAGIVFPALGGFLFRRWGEGDAGRRDPPAPGRRARGRTRASSRS